MNAWTYVLVGAALCLISTAVDPLLRPLVLAIGLTVNVAGLVMQYRIGLPWLLRRLSQG